MLINTQNKQVTYTRPKQTTKQSLEIDMQIFLYKPKNKCSKVRFIEAVHDRIFNDKCVCR